MESYLYETLYGEFSEDKTKSKYKKTRRAGECTVCGKLFNSSSAVYAHMRIHTGDKPYICEMCGKGFNQNSNLKRHIKCHLGQKDYYCEICNKHISCSSKPHFLEHVRAHSGEKPYACEYCDNSYGFKASLINHMKSHTKKHFFICDICHKGFSYEGNLNSHMRIHNAEYEANKCDLCKEVFKDSSRLNDHLAKSHDIFIAYECKVCQKRFYNQQALRMHYEDHDDHEPITSEATKRRRKRNRNDPEQENATVSTEYLNQNEDISSDNVTNMKDIADIPTLSSCVKEVITPAQLELLLSHDRVNHKFPYGVSKKEFGSVTEKNEDLETHIKSKNVCIIENEDISYITGSKAEEISSTVSLDCHVQEILTSEVITPTLSNCKLICGVCEKEFFCEAEINKHLETHINRENAFVVQNEDISSVTENEEKDTVSVVTSDIHAKTIITPDELKVLLRHGPVNYRFLCGVCKKDFSSKTEIDEHLRTHINDEKLFICGICKGRFSSGDELKSHITESHDI